MGVNLFNKVWDLHSVSTLPTGQTQLFIGLHLIHEVTSPQAFDMLNERNLSVLYPERTFATVDHIIPTNNQIRPFKDILAEQMISNLEKNVSRHNIKYFDLESNHQGIVHVIGPELGLTQPGMTIACGDSHTSTHGAFGAIAFGIGTSQVRDVLATQTIAMSKLKVRQININGILAKGVYGKDVILNIIQKLGVKAGIGYAYEFSGTVIEKLNMEQRMSICNMSIEGGARCGYINPDATTFDYIKNRKFAPVNFNKAKIYWKSISSDHDAEYDDIIDLDGNFFQPTVTWGVNPGQSCGIEESIPTSANDQDYFNQTLNHMHLKPGQKIKGSKIDIAFIGSCTNSRISDLRESAKILSNRKVNVKTLIVPGSQQVQKQAELEGLDKIFIKSGCEWRKPGCSMCLAMNPDKLQGSQLCASSSNRNFIGRQGSPTGRTMLMSPAMVAAAAIEGKITDVRDYL